METNAPATLTTPGGTILFNIDLDDGSMFFHDGVVGLDSIPLRAPSEDRPRTAGLLWHDFLQSGLHPTFDGTLYIPRNESIPTAVAQITRRNQMERELRVALASISITTEELGTYAWTPTGLDTIEVVCRCDIPPTYPDKYGKIVKGYQFGLVVADPSPLEA